MRYAFIVQFFVAMPKRPPTPPTVNEYKYFTVHQAYPQYPNLELVAHCKELAFWISNALGDSSYLSAMYHKPKVRGS